MIVPNLPYAHLAKEAVNGSDEYYLYIVLYTGGTVSPNAPVTSSGTVTNIGIVITDPDIATPRMVTKKYKLVPNDNSATEYDDLSITITVTSQSGGSSTSKQAKWLYSDAYLYAALPLTDVAYNAPYVLLLPKTPTTGHPENRAPKVLVPIQNPVSAFTEGIPTNTTANNQDDTANISTVSSTTAADIWFDPPSINLYSYFVSGTSDAPYFQSTINGGPKSKIRSKHYVQQPLHHPIIRFMIAVIVNVISPMLSLIGSLFTALIIKPLRWLIRLFTIRKK